MSDAREVDWVKVEHLADDIYQRTVTLPAGGDVTDAVWIERGMLEQLLTEAGYWPAQKGADT